jgi:hypothetical protein
MRFDLPVPGVTKTRVRTSALREKLRPLEFECGDAARGPVSIRVLASVFFLPPDPFLFLTGTGEIIAEHSKNASALELCFV